MLGRLKRLLSGAPATPPPAPPPEPPAPLPPDQIRYRIWEQLSSLDEEDRLSIAREVFASILPPEEFDLIPELSRRTTPPLNTWRMQNELLDFNIPPDAKVLDIGSGGFPFTRATHLADLYPHDTTHRMEQLKRDDRPFDVVDIQSLPYADQAFDFVFCSHVLEHLDNPGQAIREMQRIAPRGYVETPTRLSDVMFDFTGIEEHHRWHGLNLSGTLALIEWPPEERRTIGSKHFFNLAQSNFHNPFQSLLEKNWDYFFVGIKWEGNLPFVVISKDGSVIDRS